MVDKRKLTIRFFGVLFVSFVLVSAPLSEGGSFNLFRGRTVGAAPRFDESVAQKVAGKILIQVEQNGEAWYVYPRTLERHYLGRDHDAFEIMGGLGLGIASAELDGYLATSFPSRLAGHIMLDVERNGEAYYVSPDDLRGHYLSRPADAFAIMVDRGLGIADADLAQIYESRTTPQQIALSYSVAATAQEPVEPSIFGYSEEGRPITGFEIGNGEYCVLLIAAIHGGRERGGKDLLDRLLVDYIAHPKLIHPDKRLIAIPLANPDGYHEREDKLNANEVNLNRNFSTSAWEVGDVGTTTYAGELPFSESESRVIRDVTEGCTDGAMVSFHSQGSLVNPELGERSIALAEWYAEKSGYAFFEGLHFAGTATRWFDETTGNPAVTVEMTDYTSSDWEMNKDTLTELLSADVFF